MALNKWHFFLYNGIIIMLMCFQCKFIELQKEKRRRKRKVKNEID